MIVDCHTHITCPSSGFVAADHLVVLDKVDVCFVLPAPENSSKEVNKAISEYTRQYKSRMVGFAVLNPLTDRVSVKVLNHLRNDLELQGVVVYCPEFNVHPSHSKAMRLYESAEELNMPVFFHNGAPLSPGAVMEYAQPYMLDEVARAFPRLKIIVGSMGAPFTEQTLCLIGKHENVYADMTMSPKRVWHLYNIIIEAGEKNVIDKMLFGSGYPLGSPEAYIESLLGFKRLLSSPDLPSVPREVLRAVIERDAVAMLGLKVDPRQEATI